MSRGWRHAWWLALGVLTLALGIGAIVASAYREWASFPSWRDPSAWTEDDLERLFDDPAWHWCEGPHGCHQGWSSFLRCKGGRRRVYFVLARATHLRGTLARLEAAVADPSPFLATRAVVGVGRERVVAAKPAVVGAVTSALERAARGRSDEDDPAFLENAAWALERLGATETVALLSTSVASVGWARAHAVEVLAGRASCAGCGAPMCK